MHKHDYLYVLASLASGSDDRHIVLETIQDQDSRKPFPALVTFIKKITEFVTLPSLV